MGGAGSAKAEGREGARQGRAGKARGGVASPMVPLGMTAMGSTLEVCPDSVSSGDTTTGEPVVVGPLAAAGGMGKMRTAESQHPHATFAWPGSGTTDHMALLHPTPVARTRPMNGLNDSGVVVVVPAPPVAVAGDTRDRVMTGTDEAADAGAVVTPIASASAARKSRRGLYAAAKSLSFVLASFSASDPSSRRDFRRLATASSSRSSIS